MRDFQSPTSQKLPFSARHFSGRFARAQQCPNTPWVLGMWPRIAPSGNAVPEDGHAPAVAYTTEFCKALAGFLVGPRDRLQALIPIRSADRLVCCFADCESAALSNRSRAFIATGRHAGWQPAGSRRNSRQSHGLLSNSNACDSPDSWQAKA